MYVSPLWIQSCGNRLNSLYYDIMKTSLGVLYHPSTLKLKAITGLPSFYMISKIHLIKFLIKTLYSNNDSLLKDRIIFYYNIDTYQQIAHYDISCLKEFLCFKSNVKNGKCYHKQIFSQQI